jgi:hypothetical protein
MLLGKEIKLIGITQKGKNRVREHGNIWVVLAEVDRVLFSPNNPGPWLFVAPPGKDYNHKDSRWVHLTHDPDFQVVT